MPESSIFFIADCHFGDEMIARYESRPYTPTSEIVERFNQVVSPDDKTYFLGDIASSSFVAAGRLKETIAQMNGYKVLVLGNHDREISVSPSFWMDIGFDEVSTNPVLVDNFFLASHEPLYITANMPYVNVFGMSMGIRTTRRIQQEGRAYASSGTSTLLFPYRRSDRRSPTNAIS